MPADWHIHLKDQRKTRSGDVQPSDQVGMSAFWELYPVVEEFSVYD